MEIKEIFGIAFTAIRTNKLRSILTLLGIVVGVFSIIAVMTAMGVMQRSIESDLSGLGANTFQVQKFPNTIGGGNRNRAQFRNRKDITYVQAVQLKERATLAQFVGIEAFENGKAVKSKYKESNPDVIVYGENPDGLVTNNWMIKDGRGINDDDVEHQRNVICLGAQVAKKVFPHSDPIGDYVSIEGARYEVIGVFEERGSALGGNQDNHVAIPITAHMNKFGKIRNYNIMVKTSSRETYDEAYDQVHFVFRNIRHLRPNEEDDFAFWSNDSLIEQFNDFTKYVKWGIIFISSIALLAAGIGIMNIMLVSVTERTREIGIRKALGARKIDILRQFIIEAVILSEFGGVIGVLLGIGGGNIAAVFMETAPIVPVDWAIIGLVICSMVGIGFGVYPAWKAANLVPIEALRYE
ncbi:MAG: ABC transporter permease [Ignavibacteriales bacterium]|nr:ABC transporter permease [Ignavibacteriales bacterium]